MKKILTLIGTVTFAVLVALVAWGTQEDKTEDFDQEVADGLLGLQIKASLLGELGWDARTIEVEADARAVTLSGEVSEKATQEMAEEIAQAFDDVDSVDNQVKVAKKAPKDQATPVADAVSNAEEEVRDAVLETRVKSKLISELGRHGFRVEVEASDGVVSLRGTLPDSQRRKIALDAARQCKGVDKVIDLLKTKGS